MKSAIHLQHASEIWSNNAPTGRFAEVIRGEVQDYGGNCHFAGTADQCVQHQAGLRIVTRLVPTECREVDGNVNVIGSDHDWQLVIAK